MSQQQQPQSQQPFNNAPTLATPQHFSQHGRFSNQELPLGTSVPVSDNDVPQYYDHHLTLRTYSDGSIDLFFHDDNLASGSPMQYPKEDQPTQQSFWQKIDWTPIFQNVAEKFAEEGTNQLIEGGRAGVKKLVIRDSTTRPPRAIARPGQDQHRQPRHPQNISHRDQDPRFLTFDAPEGQHRGQGSDIRRSRSNPGPHRPRGRSTPPPQNSAFSQAQGFPQLNAQFQRSPNQNVFVDIPRHNQNRNSGIFLQDDTVRGRHQNNQFESSRPQRRPGTASTVASKQRSRASSPARNKVPSVSLGHAGTILLRYAHKTYRYMAHKNKRSSQLEKLRDGTKGSFLPDS